MDSANFEEILTCGVCLEAYDETSKCPRILSCGHSFCQSCLVKMFGSRFCPTCRAKILFPKLESIPVNYSLKSLINIRCQVSMTSSMANLNLQSDTSEAHSSQGQQGATSRKPPSEGFCTDHNYFKELRCMDCDVWICAMCASLQHKQCRTLLVEEAYKQLKEQVSQKVQRELGERNTISEELNESLRELNEKRDSLAGEIQEIEQAKELEILDKVLELSDCEYRISEIESRKSKESQFCDKLKQLQEKAENPANDTEFFRTINELDKLLDLEGKKRLEGKKQIPKHFADFSPQTKAELQNLCQNGPVYVVAECNDGTRYGQVAVKDGKIYVYSFQPVKPDAMLLRTGFKDFISRFSRSKKLPETVFLQLTPQNRPSERVTFDIVIKTNGLCPRSGNFILLCSGLEGPSYKGFNLKYVGESSCYQISPGPPPVIDGIKYEAQTFPIKKYVVYGMLGNDSWFEISLKNEAANAIHIFGDVVYGIKDLKDCYGGDCSVTDCGLVV